MLRFQRHGPLSDQGSWVDGDTGQGPPGSVQQRHPAASQRRRATFVFGLLPVLFVHIGCLFADRAWAQEASDSVDAYLRREISTRRIPGLSVAVIRNGRVEKLAAYGVASLEFGVSATPSTLFNVASITKAFTAVAVMMQVEAGKLTLDDSIGHHLDSLPAAWRSVTVRQLLNNTSGLPDLSDNPYTAHSIAKTVPEAFRLLGDRPVEFSAGSKWSYNQTNYMLLGMLIEKLTGLPFDRYCVGRFFEPVGSQSAAFGDARTVIPSRATGYTMFRLDPAPPRRLDRPEVLYYESEPLTYAGGGLNVSVTGFAAWLVALEGGRFVTRRSLGEIWNPAKLANGDIYNRPQTSSVWTAYGLGWVLIPRSAHQAVGGTGGLRAAFFIYPDDHLAVVILTNLQGAGPESLVEGVAKFYLPVRR